MDKEMQSALDGLLKNIYLDYVKWNDSRSKSKTMASSDDAIRKRMEKEFKESLEIIPGRKYIKIAKNGSLWGFIVNDENDAKFKRGDILKGASWKAPARNSARGNIFDKNYNISWTGPNYLR